MICKGAPRGSGSQLARYLLNADANEAVIVLESAFAVSNADVAGLRAELKGFEASALGGRCVAPLYHAQIAPEPGYAEAMTPAQWRRAADILAEEQGLADHERVMVIHEHKGRRHAHVVWNRIHPETGRAATLSFSRLKNLRAQSIIEQEFGHPHTPTRLDSDVEPAMLPRSPSFSEAQMDRRSGCEVGQVAQDCWRGADLGSSFSAALDDAGLVLARGERRRFVLVDQAGGVHSLSRRLRGVAAANEIKERLRDIESELPSIKEAQAPEHVLTRLTRNEAVFTERALETALARAGFGPEAAEGLEMKGRLVRLADERGEPMRLFTTDKARREEGRLLVRASRLASKSGHFVSERLRSDAVSSRKMDGQQLAAFNHVLTDHDLTIIEGRAGTGKSYLLGAVREAASQAGYRVQALAPTNSVVADLKRDGFEARSVQSLLWHARRNRDEGRLSNRDVLIVDEAGMLDNKCLGDLLERADAAGAKVILVGDRKQLSSISRGGMFGVVSDAVGHCELSKVRRQSSAWQREASEAFSEGRFLAGLRAFEDEGRISWSNGQAEAEAALIGKWEADTAASRGDRFVFAYTNQEVGRLNTALRAIEVERGRVSESRVFKTPGGEIELGVGDRIQFRSTDKRAGYSNGQLATVVGIEGAHLSVKLDGGALLSLNMEGERVPEVSHGYAGTVYRGQGKTLDETYLLHSPLWRKESSYVALTRARQGATLFVNRQSAQSLEELSAQMGRRSGFGASLNFDAAHVPSAKLEEGTGMNVRRDSEQQAAFNSAANPMAVFQEKMENARVFEQSDTEKTVQGVMDANRSVEADRAELGRLAGEARAGQDRYDQTAAVNASLRENETQLSEQQQRAELEGHTTARAEAVTAYDQLSDAQQDYVPEKDVQAIDQYRSELDQLKPAEKEKAYQNAADSLSQEFTQRAQDQDLQRQRNRDLGY